MEIQLAERLQELGHFISQFRFLIQRETQDHKAMRFTSPLFQAESGYGTAALGQTSMLVKHLEPLELRRVFRDLIG